MFGLEELVPSLEWKVLVSVVLAVVAFVSITLVRRVRHRLVEQRTPIVVDLLSSVLVVGIVVVVTLALADIWGQSEALLEQMGFLRFDERAPQVVVSLVVLVAIQVFAGITARLLDDLTTESDALTEHQREVALRVSQMTLWGIGILLLLGVWEVDLTGLLVGAGFFGIIVGLAARETLGSLLGGLVLMFSRPFEVGDWVRVDEKEGVVSDITLMSTRIQGFDGEYIVVPNDVVTTKTITNHSRQGRLRADVEVDIDYDTDIDRAREVALEATESVATAHEFARETPAPDVIARRLDDSAVVLSARIWVNDPTARRVTRVNDDLVCAIKAAFEKEEIKIPFPQRELSGRDETDGFRVASDVSGADEPARSQSTATDSEE